MGGPCLKTNRCTDVEASFLLWLSAPPPQIPNWEKVCRDGGQYMPEVERGVGRGDAGTKQWGEEEGGYGCQAPLAMSGCQLQVEELLEN